MTTILKNAACTKRNKPATKVDMEQLRRDVEKDPDDYQWERAKRLGVTTILHSLRFISAYYYL